MSSEQGPRATDLKDRSARACRGLYWLMAAAVVGLGLYLGYQTFLRAPETTIAAPGLPPEPVDKSKGEPAPDAGRPERLPLEPLVPSSGADLIAEAGRVASDLAERFPQNADAHEMLARFHVEFADLDAAAKAWQRCLELNENYAYAHAGLAKIATERGQLAEAVAHWRRAVLADPATAAHQVELGKALLASGEVDEAIGVLEGAAQASPAYPVAYAELGSARLQKRDDAGAKVAFERALELDPRHAPAHFGLATACVRLGQVQQAKEHEAKYTEFRADRQRAARGARRAYDDDRALGEDIARLYSEMASVYLAAGRAGPAEQLWRRAARLHAGNLPCRQALAWLMVQQNKPLESILLLRELARLEPESVAYPVEMARLYAQMGRLDDALRVLQDFCDAAPESAAGQTALAEFYLRVKNEPEHAVKHAQKAAELSGAAPDWALLSEAQERMGDYSAAIAALERAAVISPDNLQYRQLLALLRERASQAARQQPAEVGKAPQ
ncbi:MAG: tetratricopeptide repeat protein [Planctomycetes bacterium]|nr:tetratricopeptide repeat protein [Planctomycetota bacterium]